MNPKPFYLSISILSLCFASCLLALCPASYAETYHFEFDQTQSKKNKKSSPSTTPQAVPPQEPTEDDQQGKDHTLTTPKLAGLSATQDNAWQDKPWRVAGGLSLIIPAAGFSIALQGSYYFKNKFGISIFLPGPAGIEGEYFIIRDKFYLGPIFGLLYLPNLASKVGPRFSPHIGASFAYDLNEEWGVTTNVRMLVGPIALDSFIVTAGAYLRF